ncbi:MAG: hypothetical protein FD166_3263 [Bacteroidetes bacterium]|nr:MAG: hypothetical protein FD166_3263 [Bacteroidota bacterium]
MGSRMRIKSKVHLDQINPTEPESNTFLYKSRQIKILQDFLKKEKAVSTDSL